MAVVADKKSYEDVCGGDMSLFQRGKELKERLSVIREKSRQEDGVRGDTAGHGHGCLSGDCVNGPGVLMSSDGSRYEGDFKEGIRHGRGTLTFPNGKRYSGTFKNDLFHGQGRMDYPSGTVYQGEYKEGKRNGFGTMTYSNGFTYEGNFVDNRSNGEGVLSFPDGKCYTGQFKDGKFHGRGVMTYPKGTRYEGEFRNDKRHGQGCMEYANGFKYSGQFEDNKSNGQGCLIFPDGTRYEGHFKDNKRFGQGAIKFPNGLKYEGRFLDDKYHGYGTLTFPNGQVYEGQFMNDRFHGQGTLTFPDGRRFMGRFVDGKPYLSSDDNNGNDDLPDFSAPGNFLHEAEDKGNVIWIEKEEGEEKPKKEGCAERIMETTPKDYDRQLKEPRHRAADGHLVRSTSEMLLDNWLFMFKIIHAYDRKLPNGEDFLSNFYLPEGDVYMEYWGDETENNNICQKARKLEIYRKYNLKLIEINPEDLYNLDIFLRKKLSKFGVKAF